MDELSVLEKKVNSLVVMVKELQSALASATQECHFLRQELLVVEAQRNACSDQLMVVEEERSGFARENEQLFSRLAATENTALTGVQQVEELSQERAITKLVVEDLIKCLDSIVPSESCQ